MRSASIIIQIDVYCEKRNQNLICKEQFKYIYKETELRQVLMYSYAIKYYDRTNKDYTKAQPIDNK